MSLPDGISLYIPSKHDATILSKPAPTPTPTPTPSPATPTLKEGSIYKVPPRSSLSSIAELAYRDASLASGILLANRDKLPNWSSLDIHMSLPDGISLYIPSKHDATILSKPTPTPTPRRKR